MNVTGMRADLTFELDFLGRIIARGSACFLSQSSVLLIYAELTAQLSVDAGSAATRFDVSLAQLSAMVTAVITVW